MRATEGREDGPGEADSGGARARALLVRHGETDWNRQHRCQGFSDIPMNEAGREQAARTALLLSQSLDGSRPETIVASPLARAFETASIIGTQLGATVRTNPDLRELNQGDYEGWVIDELPVAFRRKWDQAPGDLEFPNGESLRDLQKRAVRAFKRVLAENEGARTIPVLVSHNLTIATILSDLLKKDLDGCLALCCPPCTPRGVELDATNGGRWIVRSL